jgi:hypothetical protein
MTEGRYLNTSAEVRTFTVLLMSSRVRLATTAGMFVGTPRENGAGFGSA